MQAVVAICLLLFCSLASAAEDGWSWATAISKHQSNGREIIFRYVRTLPGSFDKTAQPVRVIVLWKYTSDSGMPTASERERMDLLEDLLKPALETPGLATLALVSTGENLREWIYYAKTESEFFARLHTALRSQPKFPIEIHVANDGKWATYEKFRAAVKE